jgi:vibriolysin
MSARMTSRWTLRKTLALAITLAGCSPNAPSGEDKQHDMDDVVAALAALPDATVLMSAPDGMPTWVVGELAKIGEMQFDSEIAADNVLRPQLGPVLKVFRLKSDDLKLRKMGVDADGNRHFRYEQVRDGQPIIGGDLIVHVDVKGAVFGVNGTARGDIDNDGAVTVTDSQANARVNGDARFAGLSITGSRQVWLQDPDGAYFKTYEKIVEGKRGVDPARDKVYVDVGSGNIVAIHPTIHFAKNRNVYTANNSTSIPGTLRRSEGAAATADVDINAAYDNTGASYDAYNIFFTRDSYNNAGAQLISSVHYSTNYCNAFWNGTQMVYGDGSGSTCLPLARSVDVTAHELTHAVTENESNLTYSGESGGLNEAYSDIFGAFVEAWVDGGKSGTNLAVSADTWLVGEDILPPYLRNMGDPAADGQSRDVYTSTLGSVDVHYSSGPLNLAFKLLVTGGTHPRGKTTVNVPGIGFDKAIRIFYKANTDYLTASSKYAQARTAAESAVTALGYDQATKDAVGCAFAAIAVGTAPASCGGTPPPTDIVLMNGVAKTGQSATTGTSTFYQITVPTGQTSLKLAVAGANGDADLYVKAGSKPSTTVSDCKSESATSNETCTITNPTAGIYYVLVYSYASYTNASVTATYSGAPPPTGDPYITSGTPVTGISGAASSNQYWRIAVPAGKASLTVRISGPGTGDADLYVRSGARPTTATYNCRPYLNGNAETCTITNPAAGDWYIMLRGYTAYTGVTLTGTLP